MIFSENRRAFPDHALMRARQAQEAIEKSPRHHHPEPPEHHSPHRHCRNPRHSPPPTVPSISAAAAMRVWCGSHSAWSRSTAAIRIKQRRRLSLRRLPQCFEKAHRVIARLLSSANCEIDVRRRKFAQRLQSSCSSLRRLWKKFVESL